MVTAVLVLLLLLLLLRWAVLHTSASLTINENASPDVPLDLNVSRGLHCQACLSGKQSAYLQLICHQDCVVVLGW
jgi:hypothetical protein